VDRATWLLIVEYEILSIHFCAEFRCAERAAATRPHVGAKSVPQVLGAGVSGAWLFEANFWRECNRSTKLKL
jgi:hypothetical protein